MSLSPYHVTLHSPATARTAPCAEVQLSQYFAKHYALKTYGGVDAAIRVFLASKLVKASGQLHAAAPLPPGNGTHWIGGWVEPRAGLDTANTTATRTLNRPRSNRSQSLHRLIQHIIIHTPCENWITDPDMRQQFLQATRPL
jgi:hypothetical protein